MSTLSQYAAGVTDTTGWTNPTYLQGSDNSQFATWVSADRNATAYVTATTFDFSAIPTGATINFVTVRVKGYTSHAGTPLEFVNAQLYAGTTAKGTPQALTLTTTSTNVWATFDVSGVSESELADLRVRITGDRVNSTVQSTVYVDSVQLTVDYTAQTTVEKSGTEDGSGAESVTLETPPVDKSGADTGTGTGGITLAATGGVADTGSGLEVTFLQVDGQAADSATITEGVTLDEGQAPPTITPGPIWIERWE